MSSIRKFKIRGVSHSLEHQACRYALSPLLSNKTVMGTDDEVKENFASLIQRRRALLKRLAAADYRRLSHRADFLFAMNCPPVGVLTNLIDLKSCQRLPLCPFCWCRRYVTDTVRCYRRYLFPPGENHPDVELCERQFTCQITASERHDLSEVFRTVRDWRHPKNRPRLSKSILGVSTLVSVDITESGWRILYRQLFVMKSQPKEYEYSCPPAVSSDGWKSVPTVRRTRLWYDPDEEAPGSPERILAAAIGRFAIYPFGLMCGDVIAVRNLLERLTEEKPRLLAHSGVIRKAKHRDEDEIPVTEFVADDDDEELSRENF